MKVEADVYQGADERDKKEAVVRTPEKAEVCKNRERSVIQYVRPYSCIPSILHRHGRKRSRMVAIPTLLASRMTWVRFQVHR